MSAKTAAKWITGGNPKDVGSLLLALARKDPSFDFTALDRDTRERYTAAEWVQHLMAHFGDNNLAQLARRLRLNYYTVSKWSRSSEKTLKGTAEALLLYAYHHPEKFPTK